MNSFIVEGDRVSVSFPGTDNTLVGTVMHIPCTQGDAWIIVDNYGYPIYIGVYETICLVCSTGDGAEYRHE